jgi:hypothetical protein
MSMSDPIRLTLTCLRSQFAGDLTRKPLYAPAAVLTYIPAVLDIQRLGERERWPDMRGVSLLSARIGTVICWNI